MTQFDNNISLDEKISQMLILGYNTDLGYKSILKKIATKKISGVIFFRRNIKNPEDITRKINKIKEAAKGGLPAITTLDQEGGQVCRIGVRNGFKYYPGAERSVNEFGKEKTAEAYDDMAKSLAEIGINLNLAPCVDMKTNENSSIAYHKRSYGKDADVVAEFSDIFIQAHKKHNVATALKHFPGIGSASLDTHKQLPDITQTWSEDELIPFAKAIEKNPDTPVMIGHVVNKKIDEDNICSLSPKAINLLQDKMGHKGLAIMDATNMSALKNNSIEDILVRAINAGINMFIFTNRLIYFLNPRKYMRPEKFRKIIKKAIKEGKISEQSINNAYEKIARFKTKGSSDIV